MTLHQGWKRLLIVLSVAWLVGGTVLYSWPILQEDDAKASTLLYGPVLTSTPVDYDPFANNAGSQQRQQSTPMPWELLYEPLVPTFKLTGYSLLVLLPIALLWAGAYAFLWVAAGFGADKTKPAESTASAATLSQSIAQASTEQEASISPEKPSFPTHERKLTYLHVWLAFLLPWAIGVGPAATLWRDRLMQQPGSSPFVATLPTTLWALVLLGLCIWLWIAAEFAPRSYGTRGAKINAFLFGAPTAIALMVLH